MNFDDQVVIRVVKQTRDADRANEPRPRINKRMLDLASSALHRVQPRSAVAAARHRGDQPPSAT